MASKLMFAVLVVFLSLAVTPCQSQKTWALLIASAKEWYNYGMQSDVFHAYQVIKEGGILEEQIVVMAFDDLASSPENPFPGKVFQSYDLDDVYKGVKIDYSGKDISKELFRAVLRGDQNAVKKLIGREGKVIDSGPDDNVFVFIDDHGGPGIVYFFDGNNLHAKELNETITYMHQEKRYKHMVIYIDTCFSGSMFEDILSPDIGVYAATAANKTQVAWSADCDSLYFTGHSSTCLGGLFSINWAYETQSDDRAYTTLDQQFQEARIACRGQSNPKQYGDLSIAKLHQSVIFGLSSGKRRELKRSARGRHGVPKHMLPYHIQKKQLEELPEGSPEAEEASQKLQTTVSRMSQADEFMKGIATALYGRFVTDRTLESAKRNFGTINWRCYEPVLEAVSTHCPGMSHREDIMYYAISQYGILVNLCNEMSTDQVLNAVKNVAEASPLCKL